MSTNSVRIFHAGARRSRRPLLRQGLLAVGLGLAATLLLACAGIPKVSSPPAGEVHSVRAETPHEWSRRSVACTDARKRARVNAQSECELAQLTADKDACSCERDPEAGGGWVCSAEADYVCVAGR
jgi:hypothetical protein